MFLLTNGGPNGSTEVVMTLIYKLGSSRTGSASERRERSCCSS